MKHGTDKQAGLHCAIPLSSQRPVSVQEFQDATRKAKNKGQKLRVAYRTLSSLGYGNLGFWSDPSVREFIEDFKS